MGKVYLHKPHAVDEQLGRVEPDSGKVYRRRVGPDQNVGRVELDSGKVYSHRVGPDKYVGRIKSNGRVYLRDVLAPDDYVGRVQDMHSLAEGGAAFFLLLLPAMDQAAAQAGEEQVDEAEAGEGE